MYLSGGGGRKSIWCKMRCWPMGRGAVSGCLSVKNNTFRGKRAGKGVFLGGEKAEIIHLSTAISREGLKVVSEVFLG